MMLRGLALLALMSCAGITTAAEVTLESAIAEYSAMHNEEAQRQFELLQAQKPGDVAVLYHLGRLQWRAHHRKQAVQTLRHAVELQPARTLYQLGLCEALGAYIDELPFYRKLGIAQEIHRHLEVALANDPRSINVHDGLMKFYLAAPALIGGGRDKAWHEAEQIATLDPASGHLAFGVIANHEKRYADAARELLAAVQLAPGDPMPRYALGQVQLAQQHYDAALATYQDVQRLFPRETAVYYHLANTAALSGQKLERGAEALKTYLARGPIRDEDPTPVQAYTLLGRLSELGRRRDDALSAYRIAQQLDPVDAEVAQALQKLD